MLAAGADLERDGEDGEPISEVRKLWDIATTYTATNGTREGAATRLASGFGMAFAPGEEGIWPLPGSDRYAASTYQLQQLVRVLDRTPLARGHDFGTNHVMLDLNIETSGPTIAPTAGCGLRYRLQVGHTTKVSKCLDEGRLHL